MSIHQLSLFFLTGFTGLALSGAAEFDLILRQGSIVDGTGKPAFIADLGIKDERIARIGRITATGKREINLAGWTIAPGFIDVHTHAENIEKFPGATNFLRMGVTTLVLGNCGGSRTDLPKYFSALNKIGISPNVATLIGHNTVRSRVMGGSFMRPPTSEEIEKMKSMVNRAMEDGVVGLATGLIYLPGTFARTEEIIELAKVASAHDGIYVSHMRSESDGVFDALDELFRIAREAKMPAHISHIKASSQNNWGNSTRMLEHIGKARREGLSITQDQYVYPASSTGISSLIPQKYRAGTRDEFRARMDDVSIKGQLIREMKDSLKKRGVPDFSYAVIASWSKDKTLNGLNLRQAAAKRRGSDSIDAQIELILEIHASGGASGVYHSQSEDDLRRFQKHPLTMFASDSGVREFGNGVPHPRGYGNNARALARYVRELKNISLEDAIRRMTSLPATTFQLKDRGVVREGAFADLAVFNPQTVQDHATFEKPHQYATGFRLVIVNGKIVVENDRHLDTRPGKTLKRAE